MIYFGRLNQIRKAIEDKEQATCPLRYQSVMKSILELPVAAWNDPGDVAGEIDTENRRTKMTWGNNNGGGYGQEDVYGRLNNAKDVGGARFPFIEDGKHKFAVVSMEEFTHSTDGPSARVLLKVLESNKPQTVGTYAVKIYKLVKPPFKPGMTTDSDAFADFCRKLKGAPLQHPIGNDIRVLMKERARDQLARGMVIDCSGVMNKKGNFVNLYWTTVQQGPAEIAQMRARLEAEGIPDTGGSQQQGYQQQPAQQGYGAPAGYAPPPPQQGYTPPPAPAPQQGGFIQQLPPGPPTNGGNGNQGGGW